MIGVSAPNQPDAQWPRRPRLRAVLGRRPQIGTDLGNGLKVGCENFGKIDQGANEIGCRCRLILARAEPDHAGAWFVLGMALLAEGEFEEGWEAYEWRWQSPGFPGRDIEGEEWRGGDIAGQTILVHAEQGIGDTIQFARYAADLHDRGARVLFYCQPSLAAVFESLAGVNQVIPEGGSVPPFDQYVGVMSLPHQLETTLDTIPAKVPYLAAPADFPSDTTPVAKRDPRGFGVGICWAGRPGHADDANRSCALADLLPLGKIPGVTLFSLQKDPRPADLPHLPSVTELGDRLSGFGPTAQCLVELDLVVTVDTVTAHLAGAMGRPVWLLLPVRGEWRWALQDDTSPWYPTMRIFRQLPYQGWPELVDRVAAALRLEIEG